MNDYERKSKLKNWVYLCIGTVVTVVLLSWALKSVSPKAVWQAFKQAQLEWLFLGWIAYIGVFWIRARRWGTLLSASGPPGRFQSRLCASFVGFGAASVLPAYAGEFIRAAMLNRLDFVSLEAAFGSIFAERLMDVGVVLLLLLIPLWLNILPSDQILSQLPLGWIAITLVLGWIIFLIAATHPVKVARFLGAISEFIKLGRFKDRIESSAVHFLGGLNALRQPKRTLIALFETLCSWLLNAITFWAGLMAFGITEPGLPGALFIQSISAFAIALPSTPGYVGPFEASIRFSLGIYQVPVNTAIAYSIALRFIMYVTIPIIAGIIAISMGMFSWKKLYANEEKIK